jgi:hypothetical protein
VNGGMESSELQNPEPQMTDGANLRGSANYPPRLSPMPADKILFPRRMLYVEAVLYVVIAATSFGVGCLVGRGGHSKAASADGNSAAVEERVPLEGTVMVEKSGKKQPDAGAIVIALPADRSLKPLPAAKFRPGDPTAGPDDPAMRDLAVLGGAAARIGPDGRFTLFVPRSGSYRVLIISPQGTRDFGPLEKSDLKDLESYFDMPSDLLQRNPYKWNNSKDVRPGMKPIEIEFTE